jgi:hypothetical protein
LNSKAPTFVDQLLQGRAVLEDIDNYVDKWHEGDDPRELHESLGLDWDEYALWVERPHTLRHIVFARREGMAVEDVLRRYAMELEPVAARARDSAEAREVLDWLKKTGRLKK